LQLFEVSSRFSAYLVFIARFSAPVCCSRAQQYLRRIVVQGESMPTFAYVAKDKAGKIIRGRAEADNEKMLTKRLQDSGYWVTQVAKEGAGADAKRKNPWKA
jgi:hypothetical protein